jgi:cation diffusion facilitator family transporter
VIGFFVKLFIKDSENTRDPAVRSAYGTLCGVAGIVFNLLLFDCKLFAGLISGAISVVSDAFNNFMDAASSVITLIGFRLSEQKADKDHPFGHGRMEYLAGLLVSMLILLVGFELGKSSLQKIFSPEEVTFSLTAVVILALSVAVKLYMAYYNFKIGKKIDSAAVKATGADSLSDCIATGAVLACLLISRFTGLQLDAYCGLAVSAFILFSGLRAAKETVDPLLGKAPDKEYIDRITAIVFSQPCVSGIHDLIVHDYGPGRTMISLHAEVPADADILEMHDAIDRIEKDLRDNLHCDAVIHMDPIATDDEAVHALRVQVEKLLREIHCRISIHDFRMVVGNTHTNLIFDAVIPFECKECDKEMKRLIGEKISTLDPNYFAVVEIDRSYV